MKLHKVTEGGANWSAGERQLICFARAMLDTSSQILLLDEATSTIDQDTDAKIQKVLRSPRLTTRTRLIIAHRINTISDADQILLMQVVNSSYIIFRQIKFKNIFKV